MRPSPETAAAIAVERERAAAVRPTAFEIRRDGDLRFGVARYQTINAEYEVAEPIDEDGLIPEIEKSNTLNNGLLNLRTGQPVHFNWPLSSPKGSEPRHAMMDVMTVIMRSRDYIQHEARKALRRDAKDLRRDRPNEYYSNGFKP